MTLYSDKLNFINEVEGSVFENLFKTAEIKQLTHKEMEEYKKSVLEYQDVRDAVDYAREEGSREVIEYCGTTLNDSNYQTLTQIF